MTKRGPWSDPERLRRIQTHGKLRSGAPRCPGCGVLLSGYAALEPGTRPTPDGAEPSISVCAYCGMLAKYVGHKKRLRLIPLEGEERQLALADPTIRRALMSVLIGNALIERGQGVEDLIGVASHGPDGFTAILRRKPDDG